MKLTEFEAHPVWPILRSVAKAITELRANDTGDNLDALQELEVQYAFIEGRFKARRRLAPLVFAGQLDALHGNLAPTLTALDNARANQRMNRRQYIAQSQQYMQGAVANVSVWAAVTPTPNEDRAELAVVDELLRRNAELDALFKQRMDDLESHAVRVDKMVEAASAEAMQTELRLTALANEAKRAVESEKTRIGTVIDEGQKTIAGFESALQAHLFEWRDELTEKFAESTSEMRTHQFRLLGNAKNKYEELTKTIADYQAIVQADSADRLAKHYEEESNAARKSGWTITKVGFALLISAVIPLLLVVLQPFGTAWFGWEFKEVDWTSIVARAGVSAVLVGAATVAIRMGAGFHRRSDDYKRLAMELRTMGPFLSTVEDSESVDQARLDLVNRTFGQAYAPRQESGEADAVPVTVLQQLLTMVTKAIK